MINADNIGKRIRLLRKQKNVSQEQMALNLGMYQADISNLERAMTGSGIADLFKLDMIADYFNVSLADLLLGFDPASEKSAFEIKKSEEYTMKDYVLDDVQYGSTEYFNHVSELKLTSPDGNNLYASFSELRGIPRFFKTSESVFDELIAQKLNEDYPKALLASCFLTGDDYVDIFEHVDKEWLDICRYLIFTATESDCFKEDVTKLIEESKGKAFKDIQAPVPEREPAEMFDVDYSDLSVVYRYRLMLETSLKNPSVFAEMDGGIGAKQDKVLLGKLKAACASEDAYKVWKKDLIDAKIKEVMEKQEIVEIDYLFAGIGHYKAIMPKEEVESFYCWIRGNGSAFAGQPRPATKREIRTFVAEHIADKLLGIESPMD